MSRFYKLKSKFFFATACLAGLSFSNAQVATTYTFSQSNGTFVPITGGTVVGGPTDDDMAYGNLPIGFQFQFNGTCYNQFGMGSNSYMIMGSTAPSDDYNMISLGSDDDVIVPFNSDTQLGFITNATVTSGSAVVPVTSTVGLTVGNVISSGYGFPTGTTITAIGANSFTAGANATSAVTGSIRFMNGEMRYETLGSAPNRTLVVQWLRMRKYGSTSGPDDYFNYQVRLEETTNNISIVYGPFANGINSGNYEVGLRGITTSDFNNRTTATSWASTTAGIANSDFCVADATVMPSPGLTFKWSTNVNALPSVSLAVTGNTLNCGGTATNVITASGANTYSWSTGATSASINPTSTISTVYTVVGTATNGCSASQSSSIVVSSAPVVSVTGASSVCAGSTVSLSANGASTYSWNTGATGSMVPVSPSVTTTYTVNGNNSVGCTGTATFQVSASQLPTVSLTAAQTTVCVNGSTVTLTGSPANGVYSGTNVSQGAFTPGATAGTFSPVYTYTDAVTGCSNFATTNIVVSSCTGLNANSLADNKAYVYPNPNNGEFMIELGNTDVKTIELCDLTGRIILSETTDKNQVNVNISALANGIYFVKVTGATSGNIIKVVKQ
jgi:hypothetical protein